MKMPWCLIKFSQLVLIKNKNIGNTKKNMHVDSVALKG